MRRGRVLIILGAGAFVAFVFASLMRFEPVKVTQSRLERRGDEVFVAGVLRNTGPDCGPLDLEVRYYDSGGRPLGEDTLKLKPIASGAEEKFASPPHQSTGIADFSLYLNHGRNPYGN